MTIEASMASLDRSIFRKYDIRGTAAGDSPQLTPEVALLVGKALGTYLPLPLRLGAYLRRLR